MTNIKQSNASKPHQPRQDVIKRPWSPSGHLYVAERAVRAKLEDCPIESKIYGTNNKTFFLYIPGENNDKYWPT